VNNPTPYQSATELRARGFAVIPVPFKTKKATMKGWPDKRFSDADLPKHFSGKPVNIGVLLGQPSGWIIDIDLDHPLAVELADSFLPHTDLTWGRATKPRSHRLYIVTRPVDTRKWQHKAMGMIVELRSTGCQTVAPGSVHPSGEAVEYFDDGTPAATDPNVLIEALDELAEAVSSRAHSTRSTDNTTTISQRPQRQQDQARQERHQDSIRSDPREILNLCIIDGPGQHEIENMKLARGLKLDAELTLDECQPWFREWFTLGSRHLSDPDPDAGWFKFVRAFRSAACPLLAPGIAARVLARIDSLPPSPDETGGPNLVRLIRVIDAIERWISDAPFAISAQMLGKGLGVSNATAHDLLWGIVEMGLVECVDPGRRGAGGTGKARLLRRVRGRATGHPSPPKGFTGHPGASGGRSAGEA